MFQLFLLFTLMPLLELWLLFQLSGKFGFWTTIGVVLLTGIAGAALARWQGWQALHRIRTEMQSGMLPAQALGDGVLILVAGVLLITPGVITDVVGLTLLIPPARYVLRKALQRWLTRHAHIHTNVSFSASVGETARQQPTHVVEGQILDAHVVEEKNAIDESR